MGKRATNAHDPEPADKLYAGTDGRTSSPDVGEPQTRPRIAVFGGDGRPYLPAERQGSVRYYPSARNGGNGGARRLQAALRAGGVDLVLVLKRWNGHPVTQLIRSLCRQLHIPVELV